VLFGELAFSAGCAVFFLRMIIASVQSGVLAILEPTKGLQEPGISRKSVAKEFKIQYMKTRLMILTASFLFLVGTASTTRAQGVVVFDNFTAGNPPWDIYNSIGLTGAPFYAGQVFSPSASGTLDHALLGISTANGGPEVVNVELYPWTYTTGPFGYVGSSPTVPSPPLESWTFTVSGRDTAGAVPVKLISAVQPMLASGQTYALVAAFVSGQNNDYPLWGEEDAGGGGYVYSSGGTPSYNWTIGNLALQVYAASPPISITGISLNGSNLLINGANGVSGTTNYVLMSSDLASPRNLWTPIATNVLAASGSFTITVTNAVDRTAPQRFYILRQ